MRPLLVARQPIYDAKLEVFAYELLFWQEGAVQQGQVAGDEATTSVVLSAFTEGQIDQILGARLGFVNVTDNLLRSWAVRALPRERVVLEVLEDVQVDDALLDVLLSLARDGYRIALDDFTWRDELEPLVRVADYVKLDVMQLGREGLRDHVERLRPYRAARIAEKIETHDDFEHARSLGFDYFQGYFLCRPAVVQGRTASTRRDNVLALLSRVHGGSSREELAHLVEHDVPLSYRLLRIVNSPLYGRSKRVESIHHALEHLGDADRLWVPLLALGGIEDKPLALFENAARRARMCRALARAIDAPDPELYFLAGLYSLADAFLDRSLDELADTMRLSAPIAEAIVHERGPVGEALSCVLAQEDARFDQVGFRDLSHGDIQRAYLEGIIWAAQVRRYTER